MTNQREKAEEIEKLVCEYLGDDAITPRASSKVEGLFAQKIKEIVEVNTSEDVVDASHIGNTYDSIGDIEVHTTGDPYYVELKTKEATEGFGTLANITPKSILLADIFAGTVEQWKTFLGRYNHTEEIISELNKYSQYSEETINKCTTPAQTKQHLGRELRDEVKYDRANAETANEIKTKIEDFDQKVKYNYLQYLSSLPINRQNLKAFILILIAGYHKKQQIEEYMSVVSEVMEDYNFSDSGDVFDNYEVIYGYIGGDKVTVKSATQSEIIDALADIPAQNFDIKFGGDKKGVTQTNMVAGFNRSDSTQESADTKFKPVIRFSLHWGNVFQGIQTRRFNCFKGSYIKNNF